MTLDEFASLVRLLRHKQREYFKTKSGTALSHCKDLEAKVDKALEKLAEGPGLFDGAYGEVHP